MKTIQKKVCMLGSFAVGKTSLVRRFIEGRFDDRYMSTIGVKISRKSVALPEKNVNLIIWDLAGGDDFLRSNVSYLRGAVGALVVCDLTRPQTLRAAQQYAIQIRDTYQDAAIVLVANKDDLVLEREVTDEMLAEVAREEIGCEWFLTSAKTGKHVEDAFALLAQQVTR